MTSTTAHTPAIVAAGAAIRLPRYLSCTHSDEQVAQLVVEAFHRAIKEERAAKARSKPRRRRNPR
jgi:hypothetical protein